MKSVALTVFPRVQIRRSAVKKLRALGRVPAVIYGGRTTPQALEVPLKELELVIHHSVSENILVDLSVTGDSRFTRLALVQEVQHHPLSGKVLHVDFHEVSETEKVIITVPVESVGEPVGVKTGGGVLEHVLFRVKVRALPKDLPEFLQVDVSSLEVGQAVHIGDIVPPPGVEVLGDKHLSVLAVAMPKSEAEELAEAEAAAAAPAELEVIKEKKDEDAGEEAGKPGAERGKPGAGADKAKPGADKAKPVAEKAKPGAEKAKPAEKAEKKK